MVQRGSFPFVCQREAPAGHWCTRGKLRQAIGVPEGSSGRPLVCQRKAPAGHRGGTRSKLWHRGGTRSKLCHRGGTRSKLYHRGGTRSKLWHRGGTRSNLCRRVGTRLKLCHRGRARSKLCHRESARSKLCHRVGISPSYASEEPAGTCTIPVIPAGMTITYNLSMNTFSICKILGRSIRYQRFYI